jgi:hypothetical protein
MKKIAAKPESRNQQPALSMLDRARMALLASQAESNQLRKQLLESETRAFQLEMHRDYGNPGEVLQFMPDGSLLRSPAKGDE